MSNFEIRFIDLDRIKFLYSKSFVESFLALVQNNIPIVLKTVQDKLIYRIVISEVQS